MPSSGESFRDRVAALDAGRWDRIEPLYRELVNRPLRCVNCLERLLLDRSELDARVGEAGAHVYIEMTRHTDDPAKQAAYAAFVEQIEPKLQQVGFELDRRIVSSEFAPQLPSPRYDVLLRDLRTDVELFREENVPLGTELTMLDQQYSQIAGAQTVEFKGKERTLAQMGAFLEETDRATREAAWRGIFGRRFQDHERIDGIFDAMLERRLKVARNAGFSDFRDFQHRRLRRFDYSPEACFDFHDAVQRHCVPLVRRLDEARRSALDVSELRPWDLAVDIEGRPPLRPFDGADDLVARTSAMFRRLDPRLERMFDALRGGGCLDLESRKGKAPGGYQYQRQWSRTPFIFMNAAGLQKDLVTMVHEAGHAFHSTLCRDEPLLHYRGSPTEFAEVASMSMELLTLPFVEEFYEPAQATRARRSLLEEIPGKLAWIAQIDAFQHWIHTHPGHSVAEREATWLSLDERFGHAVSWEGVEPWRRSYWQRQLHLFGVPFYYIEYGIAQLGALQLWRRSRREPQAALDAYHHALSLGGSRPLPELFAAAGLRFDFGPSVVAELMDEIEGELGGRSPRAERPLATA